MMPEMEGIGMQQFPWTKSDIAGMVGVALARCTAHLFVHDYRYVVAESTDRFPEKAVFLIVLCTAIIRHRGTIRHLLWADQGLLV